MKMYIFWLICCAAELLAEPINRERTLLIINYNFPHYESVDFLKNLYSPYVDHIVFYGPVASPGVNQMDIHKGYFGYKSLAYALEQYPDFDGYLYTNDDCIAHCWNYGRFDPNKLWFNAPRYFTLHPDIKKLPWWWWKTEWGYDALVKAYKTLPEKYKQRLCKLGEHIVLGSIYSDIIYIPQRFRVEAIELCNHFARYHVFLEIALPTTCACLEAPDNWEIFKGIELWTEEERASVLKVYHDGLDYIHPVKLSEPPMRAFVKAKFEAHVHMRKS